jgi:23S rRNA pseudouridine2605 synthase
MNKNKQPGKTGSAKRDGHKQRRPYKSKKRVPTAKTNHPKELTEVGGEMRLSRFMSLAGVASRRTCDEIIASGAVTVNGAVIIAPGTKVTTEDTIILNGQRLSLEEKTYIMLNKPVGYICSAADPNNEKTVYDLVRLPNIRLFSAGRLDLNSEGLLILTNDGDYADKLMHPRYGTEKKYRIRTIKGLTPEDIDAIRNGIYDMGEFLKPKSLKKIKEKEYFFIMAEGKKREIRRLILSTGKKVIQLRRVAIGDLTLGSLPLGKWRTISRDEINQSLA